MTGSRIFALLGVCLCLTGCFETQKGDKIGVITKLAKQGWLCPTWEAQIIRGGLSGGNGAFGQPFNFTIEDDALAAKAQAIMDSQKEAKITYHKEAISFCRSESINDGEHNFFLDSVEVIESIPQK